jgi:excinuclease ABC subunit C
VSPSASASASASVEPESEPEPEPVPIPPPPPRRDPRARRDPRQASPTKRPDRIFLPHAKDAIPIRPESGEMFVLQHLRDEAHRFAVTFHRSQRKRRTLRSAISDIPGIGATRQRALLRHFGSLKKIREASIEALLAVPGINRKVAQAVLDFFAVQPDAPGTPPAPPTAVATATEEADADEDALESAFSGVDEE